MQTCRGFFLKSLLESPGNLEICSVKFVDTLILTTETTQITIAMRDFTECNFVLRHTGEWDWDLGTASQLFFSPSKKLWLPV